MKKTIKQLVAKFEASEDGKATGGFFKVKGGFASLFLLSTNNADCSNTATKCTGDNTGNCTNTKDCTGTDNGKPGCTNSTNCYY